MSTLEESINGNATDAPRGEMLFQKKIAIVIVLLYALFIPPGAYLSLKLMGHTSVTYTAPSGTVVGYGVELSKRYFSEQLPVQPLYLLVTSRNTSESIVLNPRFNEFSLYLAGQVKNKTSPIYGKVMDVMGYFLIPDYSSARAHFLGGQHNQMTLLQLNINTNIKTTDALPMVTRVVNAWCEAHNASFLREYTSVDLVTGDASDGIVGDLMRVDVFSIPIAFLMLAYCVGSLRLLLVTALSFMSTIVITFSVMYPISFVVKVSSFAPELALGIMAAISVDYSLFILTRFREQVTEQELLHGKTTETQWIVVKNTAILSAHNIIVSGLTIAVAVGSLSFIPVAFLSTIGLTSCVGAFVAVFVSLTVQPAQLLIFYNFFSRSVTWEELKEKLQDCRRFFPCCKSEKNRSPMSFSIPSMCAMISSPCDRGNITLQENHFDMFEAKAYKKQCESFWFRIGVFSVSHPFLSIFGVIAFGIPFFYFSSKLTVDFDLFSQIPEDSPHGKILQVIQQEIGAGSAIPFYIILAVRDAYSVNYWNGNELTDVMRSVLEGIVSKTDQKYESVMTPNLMVMNGKPVWLSGLESLALAQLSPAYAYLFNRTVSLPDMNAVFMALTPPMDPFGASADAYLNTVKEILEKVGSRHDFLSYGISGASSGSWALMHTAMDFFPYQIIAVFGCILLFVFAVFRSIVLPLRMVFTVAYTVFFSYGVGVIVFQYPWLRPVWKSLAHVEHYCFLVPIFAFMLLSALALDYDIFLMTRIVEFKKVGYTNEAAITKAVWKTGRIISLAGLVMLVTIGGLTFSTTMLLSQIGVICGAAVFVDTFIIRPFFAPALMSVLPSRALWWPRRFPELGRDTSDMRVALNIEEEITISAPEDQHAR